MKKTLLIALAGLASMLVLFEVDVDYRFALPRDVEQLNPEQEERFAACMQEQDRIVHGETFAQIDNPDVQREVLARRMREAARHCRDQFPERRETVRLPFEFNLIDLKARF